MTKAIGCNQELSEHMDGGERVVQVRMCTAEFCMTSMKWIETSQGCFGPLSLRNT